MLVGRGGGDREIGDGVCGGVGLVEEEREGERDKTRVRM